MNTIISEIDLPARSFPPPVWSRAQGWTALFLLVLLLFSASGASAQDTGLQSLSADLRGDVSALPSTENAWWLLGGAALTLLAHEIEDPDGAERALNQGLIDPIVDFGNIWGDMRVQVPLALGCWVYGGQTENDGLAGLGYDLSRSLLLTYGVTGVIKHAADRTRPNGATLSFPSGHSAAAFSTAGVISRRYGRWAGGAAIGLGTLTALGRMEDRKHYASDVVAGAAIGWIIGRTVARDRQVGGVAWQLMPGPKGLVLAGRF